MIIQVIQSVIIVLILLFLIIVIYKKNRFKKRVYQFYNPKNYPEDSRKKIYKEYKEALKNFDKIYTSYYDYLSNDHEKIFKCPYLVKNKIASDIYDDYKNDLIYYEESNIREEAVEKIAECIERIYVIKSAIEYFADHMEYAHKTKVQLQQQGRGSVDFHRLYSPLVKKRIYYLNSIVVQSKHVIDYLEEKEEELIEVVEQLEKIKKPTLLGTIFNVITAPIRHAFNIADSILTNNQEKFVKSASMLGLSFLGAGIIAEAIDALDVVDSMQLPNVSANPDLHYVEAHNVDSYIREDGTVVSGYLRGGEDGYLRSNPDDSIHNNL